jgi:hypothetical protein
MCLAETNGLRKWRTEKEIYEARLKLLESDLADCHNPAVLARWPNLSNEKFIEELKIRIKAVKELIEECGK